MAIRDIKRGPPIYLASDPTSSSWRRPLATLESKRVSSSSASQGLPPTVPHARDHSLTTLALVSMSSLDSTLSLHRRLTGGLGRPGTLMYQPPFHLTPPPIINDHRDDTHLMTQPTNCQRLVKQEHCSFPKGRHSKTTSNRENPGLLSCFRNVTQHHRCPRPS